MTFTQLYLKTFFHWVDTTIDLAPGLTLLIGQNGAGKSSLLEAISWVCWGKTIRGGSLIKEADVIGRFTLPSGRFELQRTRSKTTSLLTLTQISDVGTKDLSGATPTETQERICRLLGEWETWLSTRVFSGQRGITFGGQSNADRQKVFMDLVPGLTGFEEAAALARERMDVANKAVAAAHESLRRSQAVLDEVTKELDHHHANHVNPSVTEDTYREAQEAMTASRAHKATLATARDRAESTASAIDSELREENATVSKLLHEATEPERRLSALRSLTAECPTCLQPVPPEHIERISLELKTRITAARAEYAARKEYLDQLQSEASSAHSAYKVARLAHQEASDADTSLAQAATAARLANEQAKAQFNNLARLEDRYTTLDTEIAQKQVVATTADSERKIRQAVAEVLGPRGARLLLMTESLTIITTELNSVLRDIGAPIEARLTISHSTSVRAPTSSITASLFISGVPCDYADLSGGERTRFDVAMLLATARLAGPGGLFFDEVFDPLDDEGLEGIAALLTDLAQTRQLMVVTHNPRMTALVPRGCTRVVRRNPSGNSELVDE